MVLFSLTPIQRKRSFADQLSALGVEIRNEPAVVTCLAQFAFASWLLLFAVWAGIRLAARLTRSLLCTRNAGHSAQAAELWISELNALKAGVSRVQRRVQAYFLRKRVYRFVRRHRVVGIHVLHAAACQALGREIEEVGVPRVYTEILTPISYQQFFPELKTILPRYSEIVVPAKTIAHHLESSFGLRLPYRIIPFTVPMPFVREGMKHRPDRFHYGVIARLSEEKGHRQLLMAMTQIQARCPKGRLILAGDGPERRTIERLAKNLGVFEQIDFLGSFLPSDLPKVMDDIDVLVLPSRVEGMPHALVEGMGFGKPIVATPVGAVPDMVQDGENGFLVPVGDVEALASQLLKLLLDTDVRRAMGVRGRELFEQRYQVSLVLAKIRELCADCHEYPRHNHHACV
jgi:glycosyltransferase involved in cell wall biosynthesis